MEDRQREENAAHQIGALAIIFVIEDSYSSVDITMNSQSRVTANSYRRKCHDDFICCGRLYTSRHGDTWPVS